MIGPRSHGSRLYLVQLAVVAVGIALVPVGHWRIGIGLVGVAFMASSVARTLVPPDHAGMLKVRGKVFDASWMALLGASLIVLAVVVPPQPG